MTLDNVEYLITIRYLQIADSYRIFIKKLHKKFSYL